MEGSPHISVTVPTRDRPGQIGPCVQSILAGEGPPFELIVVDQSDGPETEAALRPFLADPRLRYLRSSTKGVCAARNEGIAASRAPLLACTDDDCRPDPGWLRELAGALDRDPGAAIVCGLVEVPQELLAIGFAASYSAAIGQTTYATLRRGQFGITANLGLRKSALEPIGLFDAALGAGGALRSGGEPDLFMRALRQGLRIVDAPAAKVIHLGIRREANGELRTLFGRYFFGDGAVFTKHARLGDPQGLRMLLGYLLDWTGRGLKRALRGQRPTGLGNAVALLRGSLSSLRFKIDRRTRLYVERR